MIQMGDRNPPKFEDPIPKSTVVLDIETSGLDASHDHITCIGTLDPDMGIMQFTKPAWMFREDPLAAEKELLGEFIKSTRGHNFFIVSYNGVAFDIPFILSRCAFHDIDTISFPPKTHTDLSRFVKHTTKRYVSKDTAARNTTGLYVPSNISGAFLARIYKNKTVTDEQHMEMLQHNAIDLITTMKMFNILKYYQDFDEWLLDESATKTLSDVR